MFVSTLPTVKLSLLSLAPVIHFNLKDELVESELMAKAYATFAQYCQ